LRSLVEKIELAKELGNEIPMGEAINRKKNLTSYRDLYPKNVTSY